MSSGSSAVVTVGDVEVRNLSKLLGDACVHCIVGNAPEGVANAILAHEVILGFALSNSGDNLLERLVGGERQEHWLNVGIVDADVFHAILFLLAASELVLLDLALDVVHIVGCHHDTILCAAVHGLCIDVVHLLGILNEPAVGLEFLEVLNSLVIDLWVMLGGAVVEVDFRLDDVVERHLVVASLGSCLFARKNVVGFRSYFFN